MLLFSTILEINDTMTKDDFIELVLEWNQKSPHEENVIHGIEWHGERNVRYEEDQKWLEITEYQKENIIAVRYEKIEEDGVVWDSDYVMNFTDRKISIQLDRSYLEEALVMDSSFSTPYFIRLLIDHGYLRDDCDMPMLYKPIFIKKDNIKLLTDVINGDLRYRLPILYVSKTGDSNDPVDIWRLSQRLKGVAHVLVEERVRLNEIIQKECDDPNVYNGTVCVYFPNRAYGHKKYAYREYEGSDVILMEKVIRSVIQYNNAQMTDTLYTWQGVNNALLRELLHIRGEELSVAESEKQRAAAEVNELDELIESVDEDNQKLKKQVEALTRANESLIYENQGLRAKLSRTDNMPILYLGEEEEFFPDEIKAMLLDALKLALPQYEKRSRRKTVVQDIIANNDCKRRGETQAEELKKLLKGYKTISGTMKRSLQDMGFAMTDEGKHLKLIYHGDGRYTSVLAHTPSDSRSGMNIATDIIREMF